MNPASNQSGPRAQVPGVNAWNPQYLEAEYARFKQDPDSMPADLRAFFQGFDLGVDQPGGASTVSPFQSAVDDLIWAYREQGHLAAQLDPFGRERERPAALKLASYGLSNADLDKRVSASLTGVTGEPTLRTIVDHLEHTYCRSIGIEYMHIQEAEERAWFLERFEQTRGMVPMTKEEKIEVLDHLARAEAFEGFLHKRYASEKRFSLEGGISLVPLLDSALDTAANNGVEEIVLGMAHRGRLAVLNTILGKTYEQIFTEFEDNWEAGFADGGGDVKYHAGYSGERQLSNGKKIHIAMASNPSHLEAVDPVVLGRCRAKQRLRGDRERRRVVPILMHGDGAIAGQGIVAECVNMSRLDGYTVGGCVHVVVNNLIAFTTIPADSRSSTYCTDIAKSVGSPVFHVNAEDPEACVRMAALAIEYRQKFRKDVFIDMWCYRKYGHNEGDEPSFTQPMLAKLIKERKSTLSNYADRLLKEGVITPDDAKSVGERLDAALDKAQSVAKSKPFVPAIDPGSARWAGVSGEFSFAPTPTGVKAEVLREVCAALGRVPDGFNLNPKLASLLKSRSELTEHGQVSHADAELLAIGSLLLEGLPVRLSGQDCRRGTFTHRHAVLRDFASGEAYTSLNNMREMADPTLPRDQKGADGRTRQARFCVYDSPLSEYAVMGFDYGYSLADPGMLVMWEAQFGDFANGAQVVIDQFIASAEIKWRRWSGLVLLLPHGHEGAGSEHSSARPERFLTLCADNNIQVCSPTTAAQTFHMLRRQVARGFRKPLIVMTPKGLLRTPTSNIEELTTGSFQELLDDTAFVGKGAWDRKNVKRVLYCSGKMYHELVERRNVLDRRDVAILRVEQFYPFHAELAKMLDALYPKAASRAWVQEEPRNNGAWHFLSDAFRTETGIDLTYIGREASASTAAGSKRADKALQEEVLTAAIGPKPKESSAKGAAAPVGARPKATA